MSMLREEVERFAEVMELKLLLHDDKEGWKDCDPKWLLARLREETNEIENRLARMEKGDMDGHVTDIAYECADVANFAMMIYDVIRLRWAEKAAKLLGG